MQYFFYPRQQAPFYLKQIGSIVNCCNVPKFRVQFSMNVVALLSTFLIINYISVNSSIFAQKKNFNEKHHHQKLNTF